MSKKKITEIVCGMLETFLPENGFSLWDCEYVKEGPDRYLRVYIDRTDGAYISTDDCELVSRFLDERLDEEDPIPENYILEVSSPGLDRPLVKPEHYARYGGKEVEVKLYKAIDGVKNLQGVLESFDAESGAVTVRCPEQGKNADPEGKTYELALADIAKANLAVVF